MAYRLAQEAMDRLVNLPPHTVVVCSIGEPQDLLLMKRLVVECPTGRAVAIVGGTGDDLLFEALRHGAVACLPREAGRPQWLGLLRHLGSGSPWIESDLFHRPGVARQVLAHFQRMGTLPAVRPLVATLSPREEKVLQALRHGDGWGGTGPLLERLALSREAFLLTLESVRGKLVSNTCLEELVHLLREPSQDGL